MRSTRLIAVILIGLTPAVPFSRGDVVISEFMAINGETVTNAIGETSDWIELHNRSAAAMDLTGWHLTDDEGELDKWPFPATNIAANGYLLVWADGSDISVVSNELHAGFKLDGDGEYLALVAADGATVVHEYAPEYPPQHEDVSYGMWATNQHRYFSVPTPGGANVGSFVGFVADTKFSHDRGFYSNAFEVAITCATTGAVIRYTLDGSEPTETDGAVYADPIRVNGTTLLRAAAFKAGYEPSDVDTQTYLFIDDILRQDGTGLPPYANWGGSGGPDWEVDPDMTNTVITDTRGRAFDLADALVAIPTVSLVTDWDNWWSNANGPVLPDGVVPWQGIYADTAGQSAVRRPVSMEFFTPDGSEEFALNGSVHIIGGGIGGTSANRWKCDKLSMRVAFREDYGPASLDYPVFGEDAATEYDTLVLDAHMNWTWVHSGSAGQRSGVKYIQDAFVSDLQNAMSGETCAPHARFVHLYLNGLYWGMYELHERPDEHFAAEYFGGNDDDYDSVKHYSNDTNGTDHDHDGDRYNDNITNGDDDRLLAMLQLARAGLLSQANYEALAAVLDIDHFIDYMLPNFYVGNNDWAHKNWYATCNRQDSAGQWRYHSWDAEHVLEASFANPNIAGALNVDVTGKDQAGGPTGIHQDLAANPEYRLRFADHVHRHFFNGGTLTPETVTAVFRARVDEVEWAVLGEAARWADNSEPHDYSEWYDHMQDLLNNYFPHRSDRVLTQLKARDLYPGTTAPEFLVNGARRHGGTFAEGETLAFESDESVYYTLDGTDPREPVTGAAAGTLHDGGPILLSHALRVKARALKGGEWSALTEAVFTPEAPGTLRVTELMHHPRPPSGAETNVTLFASDFEFIEICNTGAQTVGLAGHTFTDGIRFDFAGASKATLAPGEYAVIVRNAAAFSNRYPAAVSRVIGQYQRLYSFPLGNLSDDGEEVALADGAGRVLVAFDYGDGRDWPRPACGAGHSLVPLVRTNQTAGLLDYGGNWRSSTFLDGSPGEADPAPIASVVINEIGAHTDTGLPPPDDSDDWIELYNPLDRDVELDGWYLSDSAGNLTKFQFPAGTTIGTSNYLFLSENRDFHTNRVDGTGFGLDKAGEELFLSYLPGDGTDRVVDAVRFKGQENGKSWGRHPDGERHWFPLAPTTNAPNAMPAPDVVISEIMYNPAGTDQGHLQFVELLNVSTTNVPLWTVAGPWRLNGIGYTFPDGTVITAGTYIALVSFDPATNVAARDSFLATYGPVDSGGRLMGPFSGGVANDGERLALERPQAPDLPGDGASWVIVDEVIYSDRDPWSASADGTGRALVRRNADAGGNDPANWFADLSPTPAGAPRAVSLGHPPNGATLYTPLAEAFAAVVNEGVIPGVSNVRFVVNGKTVHTVPEAPYQALTGLPSVEGRYDVAAILLDADGGTHTSRTHVITVYGPPPDRNIHKLEVALSGHDGTETLMDFPALVRLGPHIDGFAYTQFASPEGGDLRFTDAAEARALPYEIEAWDTGGVSTVWVRVPALPPGGTVICAFWGDTALAPPPVYATNGAVWSAGYAGVWHLSGALVNSVDGTAMADHSSSPVAGVVGGGRGLDGLAAYLDPAGVGPGWYNGHQGGLTISGWANGDNTQGGTLFGADSGGGPLSIRTDGGRFPSWYCQAPGASEASWFRQLTTWDCLAMTLDSGQMSPYYNGNAAAAAQLFGPMALSQAPLLGALNAGGATSLFKGSVDELRLSNVARTPDWLQAEYRTVADHESFTSYRFLSNYGLDADGDGLPDRWEIEKLGTTEASGGGEAEDWDGDGSSDRNEFIAGTDATDETDFFALTVVISNTTCTVGYPTIAAGPEANGRSRFYGLQVSGTLPPAPWQAVPGHTNTPATDAWQTYTSPLLHRTFYRGRVHLK